MKIESIEICPKTEQASKTSQLHMINCEIKKDISSAKVVQYLSSQMKYQSNQASDGKHLKASFRGRPIDGKQVKLSEGYCFAKVSVEGNRAMASQLCDQVTYWNLDKIPSSNDPIPLAVQWINFANDIHSHVQLEE